MDALIFIIPAVYLLYRIYKVFSDIKKKCKTSLNGKNIKTLIFLGSGGHTSELMKVIAEFDFSKYNPRYYVIANTDALSQKKVQQLEEEYANDSCYHVYFVPRSREVGQSWFSTIFTTIYSLCRSAVVVLKIRPNLIVCNGPGSCVPVCVAAFIFKIIGIMNTKIIFVESICRVKALSLSGKILYYFCDEFFVHWRHLYKKYPNAKYLGR